MRAGDKVLVDFSDGSQQYVAVQDTAATFKFAKDNGGWAKPSRRPSTAFGQPIQQLQATQQALSAAPGVLSGLASMAAPQIAVPAWGVKALWAANAAARTVASGVGAIPGVVADRVANERPITPGSMARGVGGQMVANATGEGASGALGLAGRGFIRTGLPARLAKAGEVVGEMVKERIPIGKVFGKAGSQKAEAHFARRLAARDAANAGAGAGGVEIPASRVNNKFRDMRDAFLKRGDRTAQIKTLARRYSDFRKVWAAGRLDPTDAQVYLSSLDEEAKPIFEAIEQGKVVRMAERRIANQAKKIADELRAQMHDLVPAHKQTSQELGRAISTKKAISRAESSGLRSLGSRFATGAALTSAGEMLSGHDPRGRMGAGAIVGGALLASPAALSRAGLALTDPRLLALLRQAPRAFVPREK